ncbi:L-histidine N(alpha)-methyltransferase [Daejeonella oryzae]|uniref:L-histidine N(alpha)-methyltransferase n=1 Tax=Daejeonella oryzae TaxID=1122943 RepID=UPI00055E7ACF|nr:L-histidine N(alpha)-methyltransferase [Daejeonella oryzae]
MNNLQSTTQSTETETGLPGQFLNDVITGLTSSPKYLESKYFYDSIGDGLFQQIMHCPEYYPTPCELEILSKQTDVIIDLFMNSNEGFDLIELGAGDALKSSYLLQSMVAKNIDFTYYPIDISANVISNLEKKLPLHIPGLPIHGLNGEYFEMLQKSNTLSNRKKVVLFLGSNIGNMFPAEAEKFCESLRENLSSGDLLLIGFDLKKDPQTILDAYNDKQGFTRDFNLNLLNRINRELGGNFNPEHFKHYPTYDPGTGSCKSYLVSTRQQVVNISAGDSSIEFKQNECIHMEISQKYDLEEIEVLAHKTGFKPLEYFYDSKNWFVDAVWVRE